MCNVGRIDIKYTLKVVYRECSKFVKTCTHVCLWEIVVERTADVNNGHLLRTISEYFSPFYISVFPICTS